MAKLQRYTQTVFGSAAGNGELSQYGSFIASPPGNLYDGSTITPAIVQSLPNYTEGLFGSLGGAYSPLIQDQNSLFFNESYQTAYLFQEGIAEWDAGTTYYIGSYVQVAGILYVSLIDNNLNHAVTNPTYWGPPDFPVLLTEDLRIYNSAKTFYNELLSVATSNISLTLPTAYPSTLGQNLTSDLTGVTEFAYTNSQFVEGNVSGIDPQPGFLGENDKSLFSSVATAPSTGLTWLYAHSAVTLSKGLYLLTANVVMESGSGNLYGQALNISLYNNATGSSSPIGFPADYQFGLNSFYWDNSSGSGIEAFSQTISNFYVNVDPIFPATSITYYLNCAYYMTMGNATNVHTCLSYNRL